MNQEVSLQLAIIKELDHDFEGELA